MKTLPSVGRPLNDPGIRRWSGRAMRHQRNRRAMTQSTLAASIGVTQAAISAWELGRPPAAEHVVQLALALRCASRDFERLPHR